MEAPICASPCAMGGYICKALPVCWLCIPNTGVSFTEAPSGQLRADVARTAVPSLCRSRCPSVVACDFCGSGWTVDTRVRSSPSLGVKIVLCSLPHARTEGSGGERVHLPASETGVCAISPLALLYRHRVFPYAHTAPLTLSFHFSSYTSCAVAPPILLAFAVVHSLSTHPLQQQATPQTT